MKGFEILDVISLMFAGVQAPEARQARTLEEAWHAWAAKNPKGRPTHWRLATPQAVNWAGASETRFPQMLRIDWSWGWTRVEVTQAGPDSDPVIEVWGFWPGQVVYRRAAIYRDGKWQLGWVPPVGHSSETVKGLDRRLAENGLPTIAGAVTPNNNRPWRIWAGLEKEEGQ